MRPGASSPLFERSAARVAKSKFVRALQEKGRLFGSEPLRNDKTGSAKVCVCMRGRHRPVTRPDPETELIGDRVRNRQVELRAATMAVLRRHQGSQHVIVRTVEPYVGRYAASALALTRGRSMKSAATPKRIDFQVSSSVIANPEVAIGGTQSERPLAI